MNDGEGEGLGSHIPGSQKQRDYHSSARPRSVVSLVSSVSLGCQEQHQLLVVVGASAFSHVSRVVQEALYSRLKRIESRSCCCRGGSYFCRDFP